MAVSIDEWRKEVAEAITVLTREVHALNPGLVFDFDLSIVREPLDGEVQE